MDSRVGQALRLLEQNIDEEVDYATVASAIGLSVFHFHHLFMEQVGETPGGYRRRIRLDAAAMRLRWTRDKVGQIADSVGYASQPSFTQAFARRYGMTPLRFRRDRDRWPADPTDSVPDKRIRTLRSEGFRLLARRYVGAPCYVADYWGDFLSRLPEGLGRSGRHLFVGLLRDDMRFTPPEQVRYDCCLTVSDAFASPDVVAALPDLHAVTLPPGLCARMHYQGHYAADTSPGGAQSISHAYSHLFDDWMPTTRYTLGGDYAAELYAVPHTRCAPEALECTILVPLM